MSYENLPISAIVPNPSQPRQHFDQLALDELADSIRQQGLLQPLIVRPTANGDGFYTIIGGERRWRAAQQIGLEIVQCNVLTGLSDEMAFILSVTENVARRDLTVIEEAKSYQHIIALGRSVETVAALFGKTLDTIKRRLDLLDLREDVQHLVARGQIAVTPAWSMSRVSLAGQAEVLEKLNQGQFPNDEAVCRYAAAVGMREAAPEIFATLQMEETGSAGDTFADQRHRTQRNSIEVAWSKLEPMSAGLRAFLECSPEDLAAAMGQDTDLYCKRMELLLLTARSARSRLRQAVAIRDAARAGTPITAGDPESVDHGFPTRRSERRAVAKDDDDAA